MRKGLSLRTRKGFTFLEIQVAIALLLVCSLAVLSLYTFGFKAAKKARSLTICTLLAQEKMEEALAMAWSPQQLETFPKEGIFFPPLHPYRFSFTVDDDPDFPFLKRVGVTVEGPGNSKVTLTALKALH